MTPDSLVARRYARALSEEAASRGQQERIDSDVELLHETFGQHDELRKLFASPVVSREKKAGVVDGLFEDRVSPLVLRFLKLLIEKEREQIIPATAEAYQHLRDEERGIVEAEARVAQPLSEADRKQLQERLSELSGKTVRLNVTVQPELIGGLVVRLGDTVYDGSVRHQLGVLRQRMETGTLRGDGAAGTEPPRVG